MHWSWTYRKNLKKERIQCNVFFLVKTLIVTLSSLFPKVILGYYICKGRGNYAATKTSLQFKQQYNYQIMTKLHNNYTRMTACHAPTTFINKVQFSKNGNWLRSWLTLTSLQLTSKLDSDHTCSQKRPRSPMGISAACDLQLISDRTGLILF